MRVLSNSPQEYVTIHAERAHTFQLTVQLLDRHGRRAVAMTESQLFLSIGSVAGNKVKQVYQTTALVQDGEAFFAIAPSEVDFPPREYEYTITLATAGFTVVIAKGAFVVLDNALSVSSENSLPSRTHQVLKAQLSGSTIQLELGQAEDPTVLRAATTAEEGAVLHYTAGGLVWKQVEAMASNEIASLGFPQGYHLVSDGNGGHHWEPVAIELEDFDLLSDEVTKVRTRVAATEVEVQNLKTRANTLARKDLELKQQVTAVEQQVAAAKIRLEHLGAVADLFESEVAYYNSLFTDIHAAQSGVQEAWVAFRTRFEQDLRDAVSEVRTANAAKMAEYQAQFEQGSASLTEMISQVQVHLNGARAEIQENFNQVAADLQEQAATKHAALDSQMENIRRSNASQVDQLGRQVNARLSDVTTAISALNNSKTTFQAYVNEAKAEVATLKQRVEALLSSLQDAAGQNNVDLSGYPTAAQVQEWLQTLRQDLTGRVSTLQGQFTSEKSRVSQILDTLQSDVQGLAWQLADHSSALSDIRQTLRGVPPVGSVQLFLAVAGTNDRVLASQLSMLDPAGAGEWKLYNSAVTYQRSEYPVLAALLNTTGATFTLPKLSRSNNDSSFVTIRTMTVAAGKQPLNTPRWRGKTPPRLKAGAEIPVSGLGVNVTNDSGVYADGSALNLERIRYSVDELSASPSPPVNSREWLVGSTNPPAERRAALTSGGATAEIQGLNTGTGWPLDPTGGLDRVEFSVIIRFK